MVVILVIILVVVLEILEIYIIFEEVVAVLIEEVGVTSSSTTRIIRNSSVRFSNISICSSRITSKFGRIFNISVNIIIMSKILVTLVVLLVLLVVVIVVVVVETLIVLLVLVGEVI